MESCVNCNMDRNFWVYKSIGSQLVQLCNFLISGMATRRSAALNFTIKHLNLKNFISRPHPVQVAKAETDFRVTSCAQRQHVLDHADV